MPGCMHLALENAEVLRQGLRVVLRLDESVYAGSPAPIAEHGAGSHLRHCIDYYECFLTGLDAGRVDYDKRRRDERVERDPRWATARLRELAGRLEALTETQLVRALRVKQDVAHDEDEELAWAPSTPLRELRFLLSHTIHHYALVAMILRHAGVDPGAEFGVAPSTLRHWKEAERCAPRVGTEA